MGLKARGYFFKKKKQEEEIPVEPVEVPQPIETLPLKKTVQTTVVESHEPHNVRPSKAEKKSDGSFWKKVQMGATVAVLLYAGWNIHCLYMALTSKDEFSEASAYMNLDKGEADRFSELGIACKNGSKLMMACQLLYPKQDKLTSQAPNPQTNDVASVPTQETHQ